MLIDKSLSNLKLIYDAPLEYGETSIPPGILRDEEAASICQRALAYGACEAGA